MTLANKGIIPPKEWCHDPLLSFCSYTVAIMLISKDILPSKEW